MLSRNHPASKKESIKEQQQQGDFELLYTVLRSAVYSALRTLPYVFMVMEGVLPTCVQYIPGYKTK